MTLPKSSFAMVQTAPRVLEPMDIPLPESFSDTLADKPRIYQRMRMQYWDQFDEAETRDMIKHYWAMCTMMDDWFGQ